MQVLSMMRTVAMSDFATIMVCGAYLGFLKAHSDTRGQYA